MALCRIPYGSDVRGRVLIGKQQKYNLVTLSLKVIPKIVL
jgi:hypothetical protein